MVLIASRSLGMHWQDPKNIAVKNHLASKILLLILLNCLHSSDKLSIKNGQFFKGSKVLWVLPSQSLRWDHLAWSLYPWCPQKPPRGKAVGTSLWIPRARNDAKPFLKGWAWDCWHQSQTPASSGEPDYWSNSWMVPAEATANSRTCYSAWERKARTLFEF